MLLYILKGKTHSYDECGDSQNELSDDDFILEKQGQKKQSFEDGRSLLVKKF